MARMLSRPGRRSVAAVCALVVLLGAAIGVVLYERGSSTSGPCGGQRSVEVGGATWRCTFDEEFTGRTLDAARWSPTLTAQYGFRVGPECLVDDRNHIRVGNGALTLTATRSTDPCPTTGGPYRSGMVTSVGKFAQTYGRFSFRARLPDQPGIQPALWLYPQQTNYGPWPASGEIDVAEVFGGSTGRHTTDQAWPHLHYLGADGQGAAPGRACAVPGLGSRFHVYTVDWSPSRIRFSYDGRTCTTISSWQPASPLAQPAPFNAPFFVALTLGLGSPGGASVPDAATALPASMTVDWVRVWGP